MRWWRLLLLLAAALVLVAALGGARDEAERLSGQLSDAAQQLAFSNDDEFILQYTPRSGMRQPYWVSVGAGKMCPEQPCAWTEKSWLTVHTNGRDSGADFEYQRYVTVPRPLKVVKRDAPVELVLRKINGEVELVNLR